jgi:hypothetical protein
MRGMRYVEHVARTEGKINVFRVLVGKLDGRRPPVKS